LENAVFSNDSNLLYVPGWLIYEKIKIKTRFIIKTITEENPEEEFCRIRLTTIELENISVDSLNN
jgi:hypothetical protein